LKLYETVHQRMLEKAAEQDENVPDKQQHPGKSKKGAKARKQTKSETADGNTLSIQVLERGLEIVAISMESLFASTKERKEKELVKTISEKFHEFPLDEISASFKTASLQASIMALASHLSLKDASAICDDTIGRLKVVDVSLLDGAFDTLSSLRSVWNWGQFERVNTLLVEWLEGSILGVNVSKAGKQTKKGKQPQGGKITLDELANLAETQKPILALRYLDVILVCLPCPFFFSCLSLTLLLFFFFSPSPE